MISDEDLNRAIIRWTNNRYQEGQFEIVNQRLLQLNIPDLSSDNIVTWLQATFPASDRLPNRSEFVTKARPQLVADFGEERVTAIYSRLG